MSSDFEDPVEPKPMQNEKEGVQKTNPELKVINQALRTSEDRFEAIINQSGIGIAECTTSGTFTFINPIFTRITGFSEDQLIAMNMQDLIYPDDLPAYNRSFQLLLHNALGFETEIRCLSASRNQLWLHLNMSLLQDVYNKPVSVIVTIRNITAQKRQEKRWLREDKNLDILESITDAFFAVNKNWEFIYTNRKAEQLNNRTNGEVLGKVIWDEFPRLKNTEFGKLYLQVANTQVASAIIAKSPSDNEWYEVQAFPSKDGIVAYFKNVSKRKEAEEALRESEERYSAIIHQATAGVAEMDLHGNHLFVNKKFCEITGFDEKELYELSCFNYVHPDDAAKCRQLFQQMVDTGQPFISEKRIICKDKTEIWINETISSISDANNKTKSIVTVCIDITDRKTIEKQKDEFIGVASHELKTPVTSLRAYAQVLQMRFAKANDNESATMLQKMEKQINRLNLLIQDLLDVTKLEGNLMAFRREVFDFKEMVVNMIEEVQRTLPTHTIVFNNIPQAFVYADVERTSQVLVNLLTNAAKYSPKAGQIIVWVSIADAHITCSVEDFGIGIPAESQKYIFDRFYRVTDSSRNTYPGLGLGLYISSEIIKKQQGKIWFKSSLNEGSVFSFRLPLYLQS